MVSLKPTVRIATVIFMNKTPHRLSEEGEQLLMRFGEIEH